MLAYVLLACLQTVVLLGVARVAFSMPLGSSPLGLVLLTLTTALVSTSLGMLLAAFCKTSKQADGLGTMASFVLGGLGGAVAVTPNALWRTPGLMGMIANLTPHAHALEGFYSLMAEKAGIVQILQQVGILLLIAAVFFAVAVRRFKFEWRRGGAGNVQGRDSQRADRPTLVDLVRRPDSRADGPGRYDSVRNRR